MKMMTRILGLLLLLPLAAQAQVKLSALTGEYSLGDASFGLALNGTTDDGAAANAALATIGTGKTVILPPGKTLLTCRPLLLRAGTTLIGNGATIKRCGQPNVNTDDDITSGTTTTVTVADSSGFSVGETISLVGATYFSYGNVIASKTPTTITVSGTFQMYSLASSAAQASVTEQLSVRRVGAVLEMGSGMNGVTIRGLTIDGNKSAFVAACRWESCSEIYNRASGLVVEGVKLLNSPGEGILETAVISGTTNTDITAYNTTTVTLTGSAITAGFKVGDAVALLSPGAFAYDDQAHRIVSIGGVGDADVTVDTPFGLLPPADSATGLVTATDGLLLLKLNEGSVYRDNTFVGLNGNAVHFSGSLNSVVEHNQIVSANLDTAVAHQYGAVTYSCYIYGSKILNNDFSFTTLPGIGLRGCATSDVLVSGNTFHAPDVASDTVFGIEVLATSPTYLQRVTITKNTFNSPRMRTDGGGIYVRNPSGATLTAETDPTGPSRINIVDNVFMRSDIYLNGVSRVSVRGNYFDGVNTGSAASGGYFIRVSASKMIDITDNSFWRGWYGIYFASAAGTELVNVLNNGFHNQYGVGVHMFDMPSGNVTVAGNTFDNPNITYTFASWRGINGMPTGTQIIGNTFNVGKGNTCIEATPSSARDYSVAGSASIISGNICRKLSGGSVTDSIRVGANATGLIVTNNYLWKALADAGTSTVTTPANVVIP